jgi:hypothetical protein
MLDLVILLGSSALLFAAGYITRAQRKSLTLIPNPSPYPTADDNYWLVKDRAGNLALTDEQVEAARDRAVRLGL